MNYQLTTGDCILRLTDNSFIPPDPANIDFQAYQAWLAQGHTPGLWPAFTSTSPRPQEAAGAGPLTSPRIAKTGGFRP